MPRLKLVPTGRLPDLYDAIRFDAEVESSAFRRLAELDIEGTRVAFARLVDRLDFSTVGSRPVAVVLLLLDVLQRVNRRVHRPLGEDPSYHDQRTWLVEAFSRLASAEEARSAFMPALARLLAPVRTKPTSAHPLVERAQSYIEDNYQRRLALSPVARQLHVSSNYLSRIFRRETGTTLTDYIHRVRLEHARILLAAGGRSISEIAYMVGYQTYRDFYRNFVKHERASPRQAQQRLARAPKDLAVETVKGESP